MTPPEDNGKHTPVQALHILQNLHSPGVGTLTHGFQACWLPLLVQASHEHHWDLEKGVSADQEKKGFVGLNCAVLDFSSCSRTAAQT